MSDKQKYYEELHNKLSKETGVSVPIIVYIRSLAGNVGDEGLNDYMDRRFKNLVKSIKGLESALKSDKFKDHNSKMIEVEDQLNKTKKNLQFRMEVIKVLATPSIRYKILKDL